MENLMPNKTIYVSDDDLPLFERAQELSGSNLSSAIVRALRRFIEVEEAGQRGLREITVTVNGDGAHAHKRFLGTRLVRWLQPTADGKGTEIWNVYRTAGERYAVHTRKVSDWPRSAGDPDYMGDPKNWGLGNGLLKKIASLGHDFEAFKEMGDFTLQVFESLEDLKAHVPDALYQAVNQALDEPEIEDVDI
jgi:EXLDI family protein